MTGVGRAAARSVGAAVGSIAAAGLIAGSVRVLPWLLDPSVSWRVAGPFARGLAAVAFESALLVGWPLGWAMACYRIVDRGEARVLQSLGEGPRSTMRRLSLQGGALALLLSFVSLLYGRDAQAPGRVATELVDQARVACASSPAPTTYVIPFTNFTWLCAPDWTPRLVGAPGGRLGAVVVSARGARIAGDFRAIDLDDARVLIEGQPNLAVHVGSLALRGMPAWAQSASLPAWARALVLASSAWGAAWFAAHAVLRHAVKTRVGVCAIGAVGPLASLGAMRLFERIGARPWAFALVPLTAIAVTLAATWLAGRGRALGDLALRIKGGAAST